MATIAILRPNSTEFAQRTTLYILMPVHSSHLLLAPDVGCFAMLKHAYGRFISNLVRRGGYNRIDKFDFLDDY